MEFTTAFKIFEINTKIYPTNFSGFHRCIPNSSKKEAVNEYDEREIKDKLEKGNPFIVVSLPYIDNWGLMQDECFIQVKFEDDDNIYAILNTDCNVFTNLIDMSEFLYDCDRCHSFGY